jgi:hypothetical protein
LARSWLAVARLRLCVGLARLRIRWLRLASVLVGLVARLRRSSRGLVIGALWLVACVFELAYALANALKQLGNALSAKEQYQHEDDENDGLRVADKQEGENKHEQRRRAAVASGKTKRKVEA